MFARPQKCTVISSSVLSLWVPPWPLKIYTLAIVFFYLPGRKHRGWEPFMSQEFYNDNSQLHSKTIVCPSIDMILFLVVLVHF